MIKRYSIRIGQKLKGLLLTILPITFLAACSMSSKINSLGDDAEKFTKVENIEHISDGDRFIRISAFGEGGYTTGGIRFPVGLNAQYNSIGKFAIKANANWAILDDEGGASWVPNLNYRTDNFEFGASGSVKFLQKNHLVDGVLYFNPINGERGKSYYAIGPILWKNDFMLNFGLSRYYMHSDMQASLKPKDATASVLLGEEEIPFKVFLAQNSISASLGIGYNRTCGTSFKGSSNSISGYASYYTRFFVDFDLLILLNVLSDGPYSKDFSTSNYEWTESFEIGEILNRKRFGFSLKLGGELLPPPSNKVSFGQAGYLLIMAIPSYNSVYTEQNPSNSGIVLSGTSEPMATFFRRLTLGIGYQMSIGWFKRKSGLN